MDGDGRNLFTLMTWPVYSTIGSRSSLPVRQGKSRLECDVSMGSIDRSCFVSHPCVMKQETFSNGSERAPISMTVKKPKKTSGGARHFLRRFNSSRV